MTTYAELQQKIAELQSQAEELRKRELAEIIADVKQKIAAYGLSAADLGLQAGRESAAPQKTKTALKAKYRDPATGETWVTLGGAAMKRTAGAAAQPVRTRPWPQGAAVALISHTMKDETAQKLAEQYGFDLREPMDSSIKFCRIAEGAADIYPRHGPTMEWDIAAGHAVLAAAGGQVKTPEGQDVAYGKAEAGFRNGWFVAKG